MSQRILQQLDHSGLFRDFDPSAKQYLADCSHAQSYNNGELIYRIGDEATALYGVLEGAVKLLGEDRSGKYCLFDIATPGRWFGDSSALDGSPGRKRQWPPAIPVLPGCCAGIYWRYWRYCYSRWIWNACWLL